jgi:hypothetical protein
MPFLGGDNLAPVPAEMLPCRNAQGRARDAHNETDRTHYGVYGCEVGEAENWQIRKQECGDNRKQTYKFMALLPLVIARRTSELAAV